MIDVFPRGEMERQIRFYISHRYPEYVNDYEASWTQDERISYEIYTAEGLTDLREEMNETKWNQYIDKKYQNYLRGKAAAWAEAVRRMDAAANIGNAIGLGTVILAAAPFILPEAGSFLVGEGAVASGAGRAALWAAPRLTTWVGMHPFVSTGLVYSGLTLSEEYSETGTISPMSALMALLHVPYHYGADMSYQRSYAPAGSSAGLSAGRGQSLIDTAESDFVITRPPKLDPQTGKFRSSVIEVASGRKLDSEVDALTGNGQITDRQTREVVGIIRDGEISKPASALLPSGQAAPRGPAGTTTSGGFPGARGILPGGGETSSGSGFGTSRFPAPGEPQRWLGAGGASVGVPSGAIIETPFGPQRIVSIAPDGTPVLASVKSPPASGGGQPLLGSVDTEGNIRPRTPVKPPTGPASGGVLSRLAGAQVANENDVVQAEAARQQRVATGGGGPDLTMVRKNVTTPPMKPKLGSVKPGPGGAPSPPASSKVAPHTPPRSLHPRSREPKARCACRPTSAGSMTSIRRSPRTTAQST